MAPKIAIIYYSMYGHIRQMAEAEKEGIEKAGGTADLYQIAETLPEDVLAKMHAPPKPTDIPVIDDPATLEPYDGFLMGIPTRYGNFPTQWKAFWDKSGKQWGTGGFYGKYAGVFLSTAGMGGGQESTAIASMSTLTHHGIIYVPLGYAKAFAQLTDLSEPHGGGPWGAGTFAGTDGSRQPSEKEKELARIQGEVFYQTVAKATGGKKVNGATSSSASASASTPAVGSSSKQQSGGESAAIPSATTAAAKKEDGKASASAQQQNSLQQRDEGDGKGGPCGLPAKCTVM